MSLMRRLTVTSYDAAMHLDAIDLKDFYASPARARGAPAARRADQGALEQFAGHEPVRRSASPRPISAPSGARPAPAAR